MYFHSHTVQLPYSTDTPPSTYKTTRSPLLLYFNGNLKHSHRSRSSSSCVSSELCFGLVHGRCICCGGNAQHCITAPFPFWIRVLITCDIFFTWLHAPNHDFNTVTVLDSLTPQNKNKNVKICGCIYLQMRYTVCMSRTDKCNWLFQCSSSCGKGLQSRVVQCMHKVTGRHGNDCPVTLRPPTYRPCHHGTCNVKVNVNTITSPRLGETLTTLTG